MDTNSASRRLAAILAAGLVLSTAVAAWAVVSAFSLQGEVDALRNAVGVERVEGGSAVDAVLPEGEAAVSSSTSLADRLSKIEGRVGTHEESIENMASLLSALAGIEPGEGEGVGALDLGEDGMGPGADKLRSFLKNERMRERREWYEKSSAKIDSMIATKHAEFVETNGLDADTDAALAELEASVNDQIRAIAESMFSGDKMWFEARGEARVIAADAFTRLDALLGPDVAAAYVETLSADFPMIRRMYERTRSDVPPAD